MEREILNAAECAEYLRLSNAKTLELLNAGEIPATRFTSEWKIPLRTLRAWLEDRAIRDAQERRKANERDD